MSQLVIADLSFLDTLPETEINGSRRRSRVSTAAVTDADTRARTFARIEGDFESGFRITLFADSGAASAAAAAVSIGGRAEVYAFAQA